MDGLEVLFQETAIAIVGIVSLELMGRSKPETMVLSFYHGFVLRLSGFDFPWTGSVKCRVRCDGYFCGNSNQQHQQHMICGYPIYLGKSYRPNPDPASHWNDCYFFGCGSYSQVVFIHVESQFWDVKTPTGFVWKWKWSPWGLYDQFHSTSSCLAKTQFFWGESTTFPAHQPITEDLGFPRPSKQWLTRWRGDLSCWKAMMFPVAPLWQEHASEEPPALSGPPAGLAAARIEEVFKEAGWKMEVSIVMGIPMDGF